MMRLRHPLLERLELVQHLIAIERADVACLNRREPTNGPAEMHEMRLDGMRQRMHPDLLRKTIALPRVAGTARSDDVGPVVRSTTRQRYEVIARERFARLELGHVAAAVLTAVLIAREEERVRHVAPEPARHVYEARESDDGRARNREPLRSNETIVIGLDDFSFTVDHQPQRALHRNHCQWLERSIERQASENHVLKLRLFPGLYKRELEPGALRSQCLNSS